MKLYRVHILVHEGEKRKEKDRYTFAKNSILASQQVLNNCKTNNEEAYTISVTSANFEAESVFKKL